MKFGPWFWAVAFSAQFTFANETSDAPKIGDAPPALQLGAVLQGPDAAEISWEELKGKVVVLEFWNTACVPCVAAIPHLNQLVEDFNSKPVVFLSVSDDNRDHLEKFLKGRPMRGWIALDALLRPTATAFGVVAIPHTVIVGASGKIVAITHPSVLEGRHIQELLDGKPSTLPVTASLETEPTAIVPLAKALPKSVSVSISGPVPKPEGAYGFRSWRFVFEARKAPLRDALIAFFKVNPKLVAEQGWPEGLFDISATAPPSRLEDVEKEVIRQVNEKWNLDLQLANREVEVYELIVARTGAPGLRSVAKRGGAGGKPGGFLIEGQPMSTVADYIEESFGKPVVDETHLEGLWSAELNWKMSASELASGGKPDPAEVLKSVREQLGLDVRSARRSMKTLEIGTK
jgi:uncharacterized protein (TIGR03435 family)